MARSHAIYIILSPHQKRPIAAFTVKHEAQTFLKRVEMEHWYVVRIPDGAHGEWEGRRISQRDFVYDK